VILSVSHELFWLLPELHGTTQQPCCTAYSPNLSQLPQFQCPFVLNLFALLNVIIVEPQYSRLSLHTRKGAETLESKLLSLPAFEENVQESVSHP